MGLVSRLGDGQPVDKDKFNELIDAINKVSDIVWADQGALIWNGATDSFDDVAKYRIVSGTALVKFNGKSYYALGSINYGGVKFTQIPTVFFQPYGARHSSVSITKKDGSSCQMRLQVSDGGGVPTSGATFNVAWMAFGPTA